MSTTKLWTASDVALMPDEGRWFELIKGELVEMAPPGSEHGELLTTTAILIGSFVRRERLGAVFSGDSGFVLAREPDILLGPDVAFVQATRLVPREERTGWLELAPDLAVEIVSPNDTWRDVERKVALYLGERSISVYTAGPASRMLRGDDEIDGGDVLPGFRAGVAEFYS